VVEPGIIETPMAKRIQEPQNGSPYSQQARFAHLFTASLKKPVPPSLVAEKIREIIESGTQKLRHPVGPDAVPLLEWRKSLTDEQWIDLHGADDDTWYKHMEGSMGMAIRPKG
jgi:hypothetical protein